MGLWNVGGLISKQFNKTTDLEFLRKIDNFDLLFLVETHLGPDHNISKIGPTTVISFADQRQKLTIDISEPSNFMQTINQTPH